MADAPKNGNGKAAAAESASPPSADDPLRVKPGMKPEEVLAASPNHILEPDPLPALDRPIYQPPPMGNGHPPIPLHPNQPHPVVEAAMEELRVRLGEMREFLKRFSHDVGGELGDLVSHLRVALSVPKYDPGRDEARRQEDAAIAARRRQEDIAAGGATDATRVKRRAEEDAGLATLRRVQDTSP